MLACLQRRQSQPPQHPACAPKILDAPVTHKSVPTSSSSSSSSMPSPRYPSAAELDAYAQKTADSPLSIKIFPSNIRVPQHKQIGRTVNGLDTTAQRYSPYTLPSSSYPTGYQGLLAIVKAPASASIAVTVGNKGVLKSCEGRRTKLSPVQMAVAPYAPPSNASIANRHRQRPYGTALCKPHSEVPVVMVATATAASAGQSLPQAPQSDCGCAHGVLRQMARTSLAQSHSSPSHKAATATAATTSTDSSFAMAAPPPPRSGLAYSGAAVLPTQDAAKASGYRADGADYAAWQAKKQQQQQHFQDQLRMYAANSGARTAVSGSPPEVCLPTGATQLPYRGHAGVGASPLNYGADFSAGQFFAPAAWNGVLATPDAEGYNPQEMNHASGIPSLGHSHGHGHPRRHAHVHASATTAAAQLYPHERLCCGAVPGRGLCQASLLSSSLQSLECLISEIHPPCIKERMLGRGYEAVAVPRLLDHQPTHIQLPVFR